MNEERTLEIRLILDGHEPISPPEFLELFRCGDDISRHITLNESLYLLEELGIPSEMRLAAMQRIHQLGKRLQNPTEVQEVRKGSWIIVLTIASPLIIFMLTEYIHPVVNQAWNESDMRSRLLAFLKEGVFTDAKRKAEEKAIEKSNYGNLKIVRIGGEGENTDHPSIIVHLERRTIVEVQLSDRQLVEEFIEKLSHP